MSYSYKPLGDLNTSGYDLGGNPIIDKGNVGSPNPSSTRGVVGFDDVIMGITAGAQLVGGISQALGGGEQTVSGYELPPQYELLMLDQFKQNQDFLQKDLSKYEGLVKAYTDRMDVLGSYIEGMMPSEEVVKQLRDSSVRIAMGMGQSAEELVKNGFLQPEDIADLKAITSGAVTQNQDIEGRVNDQRRQLEQDLARQGVSPAQRQIALAQFENQASQYRSQQLSQSLGLKANLRQQGFNQANMMYGNVSDLYNTLFGQRSSGIGALTAVAGAKWSAQQKGLEIGQSLRGEALGQYETLGKFNLSSRTKEMLNMGYTPGGLLKPGADGAPADFGAAYSGAQGALYNTTTAYNPNARYGTDAAKGASYSAGVNWNTRLSDQQLQQKLKGYENGTMSGGGMSKDNTAYWDAVKAEARRRGF